MTVIEFSTVIGCCVDCTFCPQEKIVNAYTGPRLMSLETFAACLSNSPPKVPIVFAGFAEPFLNHNTIRMIELASDDHAIEVYTTGVGMTDEDVAGLAKYQPKSITLHIADAEGYAKIRVDERYIDRMTELSALPGVNWMTMGTIHPSLVPIFGEVKAHPMHSRAGNVPGMAQLRKTGPLKCGAAPELDHPVVLPSGDVTTCCMDYGLEMPLGNLATNTWAEIVKGSKMAELMRVMASDDEACLCRTCEFVQCA